MSDGGLGVVVSGYASLDRSYRTSRIAGPAQTGLLAGTAEPPVRDGGCGPNVARTLARLGVRTVLVTWIGDDLEGAAYRDRLVADGVESVGIEVGHGETPRSLLLYEPGGEAACYFHPSGAATQRIGPVLAAAVADAGWLAITVGPAGVTRQLLEARKTGGRLAWTVKADADAFPPDLCAELARADLVCLNGAELAFVASQLGLDSQDAAPALRRLGAGWVAVTGGRTGWRIVTDAEEVRGTVELAEVDDPTGAGDAFFAGLLAARLQDLPPSEAGAYAADVARRTLMGTLVPERRS